MDEEILETAKSICACGAEDEALLKRLCAASAQALEAASCARALRRRIARARSSAQAHGWLPPR